MHFSVLYGQQQHTFENTVQWKGKHQVADDSTSLLSAFKRGQVHGHFRNFTTATINAGTLTDYFANATGGGIKFETAPFQKIPVGC